MIGLHSEYRSTYRWHEFGNAATGVVRQAPHHAPPAQQLARGPMEPAMPRRKKYPGLAYKSNELFDPTATMANNYKTTSAATLDRARSVERSEAGGRGGSGRRSKSEGPRPPRWTDTVEPKAAPPSLGEALATKEPVSKVMNSTEYRNQFAWPKDGVDSQGGQPRKSISMGTLKLTASQSAAKRKSGPAEGTTEMEPLMNNIDDHANDDPNSKRYIEDYLWNGQKPGVHRKTTFRSALSAFISNTGEDRSKSDTNRKRYKSEYKKKFRPFSQYVFEASKGTFTKCRGLKGKADSVEGGPAAEGPGPDEGLLDGPRSLGNSDSWYREVLDLRKRAGEYKYRGWGTELAPEHITELYNKQIELWYQVSRRSSLSALSLASANHKVLPKDEADKDIDGKTRSPKKPKSFRSAPHQSIHAKLQETKRELEKSPQKTSPQKVQRKKMQGHSFDETSAAIEGGGSPRRRPRSADPRPVTRSVDIGDGRAVPRKPQDDLDGPSQRSASVAKDHIFDDSPVVKSPPEPTRVKSPEQMNMRSPDPVNWTVPLDTGKTFTVTQNVKNEECMRRAGSEQRGCSSEAAGTG